MHFRYVQKFTVGNNGVVGTGNFPGTLRRCSSIQIVQRPSAAVVGSSSGGERNADGKSSPSQPLASNGTNPALRSKSAPSNFLHKLAWNGRGSSKSSRDNSNRDYTSFNYCQKRSFSKLCLSDLNRNGNTSNKTTINGVLMKVYLESKRRRLPVVHYSRSSCHQKREYSSFIEKIKKFFNFASASSPTPKEESLREEDIIPKEEPTDPPETKKELERIDFEEAMKETQPKVCAAQRRDEAAAPFSMPAANELEVEGKECPPFRTREGFFTEDRICNEMPDMRILKLQRDYNLRQAELAEKERYEEELAEKRKAEKGFQLVGAKDTKDEEELVQYEESTGGPDEDAPKLSEECPPAEGPPREEKFSIVEDEVASDVLVLSDTPTRLMDCQYPSRIMEVADDEKTVTVNLKQPQRYYRGSCYQDKKETKLGGEESDGKGKEEDLRKAIARIAVEEEVSPMPRRTTLGSGMKIYVSERVRPVAAELAPQSSVAKDVGVVKSKDDDGGAEEETAEAQEVVEGAGTTKEAEKGRILPDRIVEEHETTETTVTPETEVVGDNRALVSNPSDKPAEVMVIPIPIAIPENTVTVPEAAQKDYDSVESVDHLYEDVPDYEPYKPSSVKLMDAVNFLKADSAFEKQISNALHSNLLWARFQRTSTTECPTIPIENTSTGNNNNKKENIANFTNENYSEAFLDGFKSNFILTINSDMMLEELKTIEYAVKAIEEHMAEIPKIVEQVKLIPLEDLRQTIENDSVSRTVKPQSQTMGLVKLQRSEPETTSAEVPLEDLRQTIENRSVSRTINPKDQTIALVNLQRPEPEPTSAEVTLEDLRQITENHSGSRTINPQDQTIALVKLQRHEPEPTSAEVTLEDLRETIENHSVSRTINPQDQTIELVNLQRPEPETTSAEVPLEDLRQTIENRSVSRTINPQDQTMELVKLQRPEPETTSAEALLEDLRQTIENRSVSRTINPQDQTIELVNLQRPEPKPTSAEVTLEDLRQTIENHSVSRTINPQDQTIALVKFQRPEPEPTSAEVTLEDLRQTIENQSVSRTVNPQDQTIALVKLQRPEPEPTSAEVTLEDLRQTIENHSVSRTTNLQDQTIGLVKLQRLEPEPTSAEVTLEDQRQTIENHSISRTINLQDQTIGLVKLQRLEPEPTAAEVTQVEHFEERKVKPIKLRDDILQGRQHTVKPSTTDDLFLFQEAMARVDVPEERQPLQMIAEIQFKSPEEVEDQDEYPFEIKEYKYKDLSLEPIKEYKSKQFTVEHEEQPPAADEIVHSVKIGEDQPEVVIQEYSRATEQVHQEAMEEQSEDKMEESAEKMEESAEKKEESAEKKQESVEKKEETAGKKDDVEEREPKTINLTKQDNTLELKFFEGGSIPDGDVAPKAAKKEPLPAPAPKSEAMVYQVGGGHSLLCHIKSMQDAKMKNTMRDSMRFMEQVREQLRWDFGDSYTKEVVYVNPDLNTSTTRILPHDPTTPYSQIYIKLNDFKIMSVQADARKKDGQTVRGLLKDQTRRLLSPFQNLCEVQKRDHNTVFQIPCCCQPIKNEENSAKPSKKVDETDFSARRSVEMELPFIRIHDSAETMHTGTKLAFWGRKKKPDEENHPAKKVETNDRGEVASGQAPKPEGDKGQDNKKGKKRTKKKGGRFGTIFSGLFKKEPVVETPAKEVAKPKVEPVVPKAIEIKPSEKEKIAAGKPKEEISKKPPKKPVPEIKPKASETLEERLAKICPKPSTECPKREPDIVCVEPKKQVKEVKEPGCEKPDYVKKMALERQRVEDRFLEITEKGMKSSKDAKTEDVAAKESVKGASKKTQRRNKNVKAAVEAVKKLKLPAVKAGSAISARKGDAAAAKTIQSLTVDSKDIFDNQTPVKAADFDVEPRSAGERAKTAKQRALEEKDEEDRIRREVQESLPKEFPYKPHIIDTAYLISPYSLKFETTPDPAETRAASAKTCPVVSNFERALRKEREMLEERKKGRRHCDGDDDERKTCCLRRTPRDVSDRAKPPPEAAECNPCKKFEIIESPPGPERKRPTCTQTKCGKPARRSCPAPRTEEEENACRPRKLVPRKNFCDKCQKPQFPVECERTRIPVRCAPRRRRSSKPPDPAKGEAPPVAATALKADSEPAAPKPAFRRSAPRCPKKDALKDKLLHVAPAKKRSARQKVAEIIDAAYKKHKIKKCKPVRKTKRSERRKREEEIRVVSACDRARLEAKKMAEVEKLRHEQDAKAKAYRELVHTEWKPANVNLDDNISCRKQPPCLLPDEKTSRARDERVDHVVKPNLEVKYQSPRYEKAAPSDCPKPSCSPTLITGKKPAPKVQKLSRCHPLFPVTTKPPQAARDDEENKRK